MPQPVVVIHGAGEPRRRGGRVYWEPLLQDDLGPDYEVQAPRMPEPEDPQHHPWAERIAQLVARSAAPVLVGHSFGASTLLKFLAQADPRPALRGLFLVATPFWGTNFPDFALTAEELRQLQTVSPIFFYHSQDDGDIEFAHFQKYRRALPHATFRALNGRGHEFDQDHFPELVADIRRSWRADLQAGPHLS
jgi:predicted alpha/beta hydrolase family esterase